MLNLRASSILALAPLLLAGACHRAPAAKAPAPAPKHPAASAPAAAAKPAAPGAHPATRPVTTKAELPQIAPAALAKRLAGKDRPVLLQVGFEKLYAQAHIPGSAYVGPGMSTAGIARLEKHVAKLPHDTAIVIYCGCCPWSHCPNVLPAYQALQKLGFTQVKVLAIAHDFGADWVAHGYPTTKGA